MRVNCLKSLAGAGVLALVLGNSGTAAAEFRRELSTDRPDKTESPYTVEAGRVQLEIDLFNYGRTTVAAGATDFEMRSYSSSINAKAGLWRAADLQVILGWERATVEGGAETEGVSDPVLRLKLNLIGNDGGKYALGVMPYVVVPVGAEEVSSDSWQGGLIVPVAIDLGRSFGLGLMQEMDLVANVDADGRHWEYVASATLARDLSEKLGAYFELFQSVSLAGKQTWVPTLDAGLTLALGPNVQLDGGVNVGLNRHGEDFNPFVGLSVRM